MMNRTEINKEANEKLRELYSEKKISSCEVKLDKCMGRFGAGWHHRHKRVFYYDKPKELLYSFNQTIVACAYCHSQIEYDRKLNEEVFLRLRGKEEL